MLGTDLLQALQDGIGGLVQLAGGVAQLGCLQFADITHLGNLGLAGGLVPFIGPFAGMTTQFFQGLDHMLDLLAGDVMELH